MAKRPKHNQSPSSTATNEPHTSGLEVVRSEEQLQVSTQVRVSGRAVLRKYVVTETVTQTFQVRHEEVRLEHEPAPDNAIADVNREPVRDGVVVEMVLHREVPNVVMDVIAVERVRLHVDRITSQVKVSEDVRKEQLVLDPPDQPRRAI